MGKSMHWYSEAFHCFWENCNERHTAGYERQVFNPSKIQLYKKIEEEEVMSIYNWNLASCSAFENGARAIVRMSSPA